MSLKVLPSLVGRFSVGALVLSSSLPVNAKDLPRGISQLQPSESKSETIQFTPLNFTDVLKEAATICLAKKGNNAFSATSSSGNSVSINPVTSPDGSKVEYAVQSSSQTTDLTVSTPAEAVAAFVETLKTNRKALGVPVVIQRPSNSNLVVNLEVECSQRE